jgi:hypothetical protein
MSPFVEDLPSKESGTPLHHTISRSNNSNTVLMSRPEAIAQSDGEDVYDAPICIKRQKRV